MTVHFDQAIRAAAELAKSVAQQGFNTVLIRDIAGRLTLAIDDRPITIPEEKLDEWAQELRLGTEEFIGTTPIIRASDLFEANEIFASSDVRPLELGIDSGTAGFIERQIVGSDWSRVRNSPSKQRVTLYGYKGGVGRSTATVMLAKHLANLGYNILVVDLDLESPGVGPLLTSNEGGPEFGLVDHLVESVVKPSDELDLVVRSDRLAPRGNGEVWIAPARGRPRAGFSYLPKLNRVYADSPVYGSRQVVRFADRLDLAITACERKVAENSRPVDFALLDSRAGVHDIAAASITQLCDLSLLFATDNQQTWTGYSELFEQWRDSGVAPIIRDRIRMVASMVPPRDADEYLERFRDRSQESFATYLYDDAEGGDEDAYNPFTDDESAPHYPLSITFSTDLLGLDLHESTDWHASKLITAAYAGFLQGATDLLTGESND